MSEKVWFLLNEVDFVLSSSTLVELIAEGNNGGRRNLCAIILSELQLKGTDMAPAVGNGNRTQRPKHKRVLKTKIGQVSIVCF